MAESSRGYLKNNNKTVLGKTFVEIGLCREIRNSAAKILINNLHPAQMREKSFLRHVRKAKYFTRLKGELTAGARFNYLLLYEHLFKKNLRYKGKNISCMGWIW